MKKILASVFITLCSIAALAQKPGNDRQVFLNYLDQLAKPVLSNLAADKLKANMIVDLSPRIDNAAQRKTYAYLEAFGRLMSGIGPWLNDESGDAKEQALRKQYREWAIKGLKNATDSNAADYMRWEGGQSLVDASFLALGLVRCPWLWENSDAATKANVQRCFIKTRNTVPVYSNWILFSSMIEAFFMKYRYDYDKIRIEYGIREFSEHWYTGDGMFSDGMHFALDYYNSYVIQPYLNAIMSIANADGRYKGFAPKLEQISKRYAVIQERYINTDGSFPVIGRSIAYRAGAFQHLADMALRKQLPQEISPAQVRCALTAVIQKTTEPANTFNKDGWLTIGLYGEQKDIADFYINTGSLYLAAEVLLPLGLPASDPFWSDTAAPWTSVKVWKGQGTVQADHSLNLR
ncbi:MAG TPA: DUF2264 domain-containing protein [Phnomibacter sp.]|nr:DUF2264 domain-containing protein [Phnomibacter sp.]